VSGIARRLRPGGPRDTTSPPMSSSPPTPSRPPRDRLEKRLGRAFTRCVSDFHLLEEGDRVMACVSGGKDSYTMLHLLERARRRAPFSFEVVAVHLDQGHPGYDGSPLRRWLEAEGYDFRILAEDTYSIVTDRLPEGATYCSLCSRLRRGILYNAAEALGCTKIALGHHRDDALETLLMNLLFGGSLGAMPAKLRSQDGRNTVIRPLLYCAEADIAAFAAGQGFPILPCDLCGSQEDLMRKRMKGLMQELEALAPQARDSMLAALGNVRGSHLLDPTLPGFGLAGPVTAEAGDAEAGLGEVTVSGPRGTAGLPAPASPEATPGEDRRRLRVV